MMRRLALALVVGIASCAPPQAPDPRYPARREGCDVQIFHNAPYMQTDNLGPVSATCSASVSDEDCLRTLKDQACKLGGDVVWGVPEKARVDQAGKLNFEGRAAHTKGNK